MSDWEFITGRLALPPVKEICCYISFIQSSWFHLSIISFVLSILSVNLPFTLLGVLYDLTDIRVIALSKALLKLILQTETP